MSRRAFGSASSRRRELPGFFIYFLVVAAVIAIGLPNLVEPEPAASRLACPFAVTA